MRFHFGVSFRWKTIKKFIIPILLGAFAYFGFNGIFDNFHIPLGFINTYALENYDTSYHLLYRDLDSLLDRKIDDTVTYRQFLEHLSSLQSDYYKMIITTSFYINGQGFYSFPGLRIMFIPSSVTSLGSSLFGNSNGFNIRLEGYNSNVPIYSAYLNSTNIGSDIYSSDIYSVITSCLNNDCSLIGKDSIINNYPIGATSLTITNNLDYEVLLPVSDTSNSLKTRFFYYSQIPIYISNDYNLTSNSYFYKKIYLYENELSVGDYFLTYKDYLDSLKPTPEPEPEPDNTQHKLLFNKIFWFDDKNTIYGVLTSIYELLFLYCFSMFLLKIATLLRNKRW